VSEEKSTALDELVVAMDTLALAWLDYRTGDEAREKAVNFVEKLADGLAPEQEEVEVEPEVEPKPEPEVEAEGERMYTAAQAARKIEMPASSLSHWILEGIVPHRNYGKHKLLTQKTVDRLQSLRLGAPERYKNPTNFVAATLRREAFGDTVARLTYPSHVKIRQDREKRRDA